MKEASSRFATALLLVPPAQERRGLQLAGVKPNSEAIRIMISVCRFAIAI
jgi:hypothetical protein